MKTIKIVQNSIKLGVIMLAMLMILQSCVCRQIKVSNNEVETSSYSFDERYIIEVIEDIDSFLDDYNVGYDPSHQSVIDSAALVWEDFKVLIDNRQYEIALDLYEKERPAFLFHHSHSEPRFKFLRDVIWPLMQEYNHPDTALVKYESDLATEYMLQVSAIDMSSEENSYMPPMHHQTIIEYGRVLSLIGRWREALALSEELVNALIYLDFDEMDINMEKAMYGAMVFRGAGDDKAGLMVLVDFKNQVEAWKEEDIKEDPYCAEYYNPYIEHIEQMIKEYSLIISH